MTNEPTNDKGLLRQRAEERLHDEPESLDSLSREEAQCLLHELRVYQLELDMQNTELRQAQEELTAARDRYRDLYDHAPVGYLTISVDGHILQANLTSAILLGVQHDMVKQPFARCIARDGQEDYHFLRQRLGQSDAPQMVELPLLHADGTTFWARLDAVVTRETRTDNTQEIPLYLLTISDITDRKQAETASAHQTAELAATMASLAEEALERRGLAMRLADSQETERQHLARELHDHIGQHLTLLSYNMDMIAFQLEGAIPDAVQTLLAKSSQLIETTTGSIRDVVADLRPPILDDYGLLAALRHHGERLAHNTSLTIRMTGSDSRLFPEKEIALFRIAQEALTNVVRHAQATHVNITFTVQEPHVSLTIADNGVGFDPQAQARLGTQQGWGLLNMRERTYAIGGHLTLYSMPGAGTTISIEVEQ